MPQVFLEALLRTLVVFRSSIRVDIGNVFRVYLISRISIHFSIVILIGTGDMAVLRPNPEIICYRSIYSLGNPITLDPGNAFA